MSSITLVNLRARIARILRDHEGGTADSGSTSTLVDATPLSNYPDDHFNGAYIYISAGAASGEERRVSDFTQSTGTVTVAPNFSTSILSTSVYELHKTVRVGDLNNAINQAIDDIRGEVLIAQVYDQTLTLTDAVDEASYLYALPTGLREVWDIWVESATTGLYDHEVPSNAWKLEKKTAATASAASVWNIRFNPLAFTPIADRRLKITGAGEQALLSADTDTLHEYLIPFVVNQALCHLMTPQTVTGTPAADAAKLLLDRYERRAESARSRIEGADSPPGAVPVPW